MTRAAPRVVHGSPPSPEPLTRAHTVVPSFPRSWAASLSRSPTPRARTLRCRRPNTDVRRPDETWSAPSTSARSLPASPPSTRTATAISTARTSAGRPRRCSPSSPRPPARDKGQALYIGAEAFWQGMAGIADRDGDQRITRRGVRQRRGEAAARQSRAIRRDRPPLPARGARRRRTRTATEAVTVEDTTRVLRVLGVRRGPRPLGRRLAGRGRRRQDRRGGDRAGLRAATSRFPNAHARTGGCAADCCRICRDATERRDRFVVPPRTTSVHGPESDVRSGTLCGMRVGCEHGGRAGVAPEASPVSAGGPRVLDRAGAARLPPYLFDSPRRASHSMPHAYSFARNMPEALVEVTVRQPCCASRESRSVTPVDVFGPEKCLHRGPREANKCPPVRMV